jgi:putative ABC transport system permease protein
MVAGGLYGTLSYAVSQRRQEIGIRMAMGARWANVVAMVAAAGLSVVAGGIALGGVASYWAAKLMSGFLFEVPQIDPVSLGASAAVLLLVALAAAAGPALNAVRTDPLQALRMD